jgi:hypothetical protein
MNKTCPILAASLIVLNPQTDNEKDIMAQEEIAACLKSKCGLWFTKKKVGRGKAIARCGLISS